jgi:prepilin-type N-terminal cleavage/methylation domain-containing protein
MRRQAPGCCVHGATGAGRTGGFTLLEVLTALVVLSLIMTVAMGSVRLGTRSWEAGITRAGDTEQMRAVTDFLRNGFSQLLPFTWQDNGRRRIAFEGEPAGVRFIAPAPWQMDHSGLLVYRLRAEERPSGFRLVLDYALLDPGGKAIMTTGAHYHLVLAEALKGVSFAYYGSTKESADSTWRVRWDSDEERFPRMVRLRLEADDAGRTWPELTLAIRTEALP